MPAPKQLNIETFHFNSMTINFKLIIPQQFDHIFPVCLLLSLPKYYFTSYNFSFSSNLIHSIPPPLTFNDLSLYLMAKKNNHTAAPSITCHKIGWLSCIWVYAFCFPSCKVCEMTPLLLKMGPGFHLLSSSQGLHFCSCPPLPRPAPASPPPSPAINFFLSIGLFPMT